MDLLALILAAANRHICTGRCPYCPVHYSYKGVDSMNIENIICRTVSIPNRETRDCYEYGGHSDIAESILRQYATGGSSSDLFDLYLENEGKSIQQLCSDICISDLNEALLDEDNQWIEIFNETILHIYKTLKLRDNKIIDLFGIVKECFYPFSLYIHNRITQCNSEELPITDHAVQQYCEQFFNRIADIVIDTLLTCLKTYYREPDSATMIKSIANVDTFAFYSWFMAEGIELVYNTYPLLIKKVCKCADQHIENYFELINRFVGNCDDLANSFCISDGKIYITGLQGNLSDYHHGGKSVQRIEVCDTKHIYYKPRSMAIDIAWYAFLEKCYNLGLDYVFYKPMILDCGNYGYMEEITYIPANNTRDMELYFSNAGAMCCIVSMLGGTDFHHENIIAHGCSPVLIDIETLLTPKPKALYGIQTAGMEDNVSTRTGRTLMLQHWVGNTPDSAREIGGFTSKMSPHMNIQIGSQGELFAAQDYINEFSIGFSNAYDFFLNHRQEIIDHGLLHIFDNCQLRYVFRRTSLYASLNRHFFNARFMRDIKLFEGVSSRLCAGILLNFRPSDAKNMWPITEAERIASSIGDIPYFTCRGNSSDLRTSSGVCVHDFFDSTPVMLAMQNLDAMSKKNKDLELFYIREDLQLCSEQNKHSISTPLLSYSNIIRNRISTSSIDKNQYIERCGKMLSVCQRYELPGSEFEYYAPVRNRKTTRYNIEVLPTSIYDGNLGILLSKFAYAKLTDDVHMQKRIVEKILQIHEEEYACNCSSATLNIGFSQGVAGYLQTLMLLSNMSGDKVFLEMANQVVLSMPYENITRTTEFDFFSGLSGFLYYSCKLYSQMPRIPLRTKIECVSNALMHMRNTTNSENKGLWTTSNEYQPLTGLAHGQSGIAMALIAAWKVLNNTDMLIAAKNGLMYEMKCYSRQSNNWYDFRKFNVRIRDAGPSIAYNPRFMHGYCSGSPGIGMSRIICAKILQTHEFDTAIDNVIRYCQTNSLIGNDTLCCGTAGWIDFLVEASQYKKLPSLHHDAIQICESIQPDQSGQPFMLSSFSSNSEISLFKGISGIAYQMMRLVSPDEIPSIIK